MPGLSLLERPGMSRQRQLGLMTLRAYLVVIVIVIVIVVEVAVH